MLRFLCEGPLKAGLGEKFDQAKDWIDMAHDKFW